MSKLLQYHTTMANPDYYWENNTVAQQLRDKSISTYEEYRNACKSAGCSCYNEQCFNDHLGIKKPVTSEKEIFGLED